MKRIYSCSYRDYDNNYYPFYGTKINKYDADIICTKQRVEIYSIIGYNLYCSLEFEELRALLTSYMYNKKLGIS